MALDDKHPQYVARIGEWMQMEDTYAGEQEVKRKRTTYLPPTEAMIQDGMGTPQSPGWKDYDSYLMRAVYHDVVRDAVKAMVGIMHMKPAEIQLTPKLEGLRDKATIQGEGLQMLLRRMNEAQLVHGRLGLLADAPTGKDVNQALPYIAFYNPQRIINWDTGREDEGMNELDLVVLDESGFQRVGFTWKNERKHRVLARGGAIDLATGEERPNPEDAYGVCVKENNDMSMPVASDFLVPQIGGRALSTIPFVFVGANDLLPEPEVPPLLGLSNLALAIYRGEADYRQTLFYQGQQTLVIVGGNASDTDEELRTGNKGVIDLRVGGSAEYIGVSASGLGEMRQSIQNDKMAAAEFGSSILDSSSSGASAAVASGEALRVRVAARTTTIASVSRAAGSGLERILKVMAEWVGDDPDKIKVCPQTDFADQSVAGAALLAFMQAKQLGLPLSLKSMHRMMKLNDMTEMDFEEENAEIEAEAESMIGTLATPPPIDPNAPGYLDDGSTAPPAETTPPASVNQPIKAHTRGSPVKSKVGKKGASAGK